MTRHDGTPAPAPAPTAGGSPDKRRAILAGARTVFADGGYSRASIDAIAAEAGVSTRTIYNHFGGKLQLFQTVITDSTAEIANAQIALIDMHLRKVTDLEADLIELGEALAIPMTGHTEHFAEHFALVRHLVADAGHLPPGTIDAWRTAGPERVIDALAGHLQRLTDRGLLHILNPHQAATQFIMLLVHGVAPFHHGLGTPPEADVHETVASGVRTFLHGYLAT